MNRVDYLRIIYAEIRELDNLIESWLEEEVVIGGEAMTRIDALRNLPPHACAEIIEQLGAIVPMSGN